MTRFENPCRIIAPEIAQESQDSKLHSLQRVD